MVAIPRGTASANAIAMPEESVRRTVAERDWPVTSRHFAESKYRKVLPRSRLQYQSAINLGHYPECRGHQGLCTVQGCSHGFRRNGRRALKYTAGQKFEKTSETTSESHCTG